MLTCATATSDKVSYLDAQDIQLPWKQIPCFLGGEKAGTATAHKVTLSSFSLLFLQKAGKIFPAGCWMPKYS